MKRLQRSRIAAACLALLLFFSATAALAEDAPMQLAPGVTWNTTPTEMMALEGITDLDDAETYSHGDYIQYGFMPDEDGNENDDEVMLPYIYYVFTSTG